jgi:AraC-like DNA-binding protein
MTTPVALAAILHMLPGHLGEAGLRPDAVFSAGGMTAADTQTGTVVHRAQIAAVLEAAAKALDQAHLGLTLGQAAIPARLGKAGLALVSGRSIAECLDAHARQMPAMQTHLRLGLHKEGGEAVWAHRFDGEPAGTSRILCEGAASFHLQFIRSLLGPDWSPSRVVFPHALRGRRGDYEEYFGAPVVFGEGNESRLVFDTDVLRRRILVPHAVAGGEGPQTPERELMAFKLREERLLQTLRALVSARLADGPVTLTASARILGVAQRTLQRRLDEAGITFEAIVDDIRRDLALQRMRDGTVSVTEVAMSLGYSDSAHFIRAFRRWTGMTPSAWRDQDL